MFHFENKPSDSELERIIKHLEKRFDTLIYFNIGVVVISFSVLIWSIL